MSRKPLFTKVDILYNFAIQNKILTQTGFTTSNYWGWKFDPQCWKSVENRSLVKGSGLGIGD
jgi:hypothetical protein